MSLGHSFAPHSLESVGSRLPWQYRVRPALFVTVSSVVAILLLAGGLIFGRRLTGSISADLSPDVMLLLALATTAALAFARIAWRRSFPLETPEDLSVADQVLGWTSSAALALLAVGCCYPANRTVDWLIWLPILVADQLWRQNFFDSGEPWVPTSEDEDELSAVSIANASMANASRLNNSQANNPELSDPELSNSKLSNSKLSNIVQQLFRLQDEQGLEVIYGTVRADFVAGQRTAVVHVGFCPPLTYLPEIEAEALPGTQAKIKVVQSLAHGTRLDVRLPAAASTDNQLWIDMAARPVGAIAESKTA